ncbi:MAG TPA: hypothetical protein VJN71_01575 [Nitrososphaerales archaeon]|nr:hypothetical protein [Nitrososphaerales archaeon]
MQRTFPIRQYAKTYLYVLLGTGVIGIGLSLWMNLNKSIVLPVFPDVLDAISIVSVGCILVFEAIVQMRATNRG